MAYKKVRIFKNTYVAVNVKTKKIFPMKITADDEHIQTPKRYQNWLKIL
jgi:hypothetical protein